MVHGFVTNVQSRRGYQSSCYSLNLIWTLNYASRSLSLSSPRMHVSPVHVQDPVDPLG